MWPGGWVSVNAVLFRSNVGSGFGTWWAENHDPKTSGSKSDEWSSRSGGCGLDRAKQCQGGAGGAQVASIGCDTLILAND